MSQPLLPFDARAVQIMDDIISGRTPARDGHQRPTHPRTLAFGDALLGTLSDRSKEYVNVGQRPGLYTLKPCASDWAITPILRAEFQALIVTLTPIEREALALAYDIAATRPVARTNTDSLFGVYCGLMPYFFTAHAATDTGALCTEEDADVSTHPAKTAFLLTSLGFLCGHLLS